MAAETASDPSARAAPRLALVPPAPLRRHPRRPDIQGLRAIAVVLVVAFHAGLPVYGGFTGVDIFFVISGFVISGSLVTELETTGRLSLRGFYARRVKRLLPALAAMLVFVAVVGVVASPAAIGGTGALTGVFAALFSANLYLYRLPTGYFDVATTLNPLLHTWTLAVEEQFYLVFPLVLVAAWRRGRRAAGALLAAGCAVSLVYSVLLSSGALNSTMRSAAQLSFYGSLSRAWEFGVGALLLLASPLVRKLPPLGGRVLGLVGLAAIGWAALLTDGAAGPARAAILPVLGTCLLLAAGTATSGGTARLLSAGPARWIGDRSYGWYLWHWPLIVFAVALWPGHGWVAPLAAAAALVPSALSYRLLENPVRRSPRVRVVRLALVCTLVALAACLAALAVSDRLATLPAVASWKASQLDHADVVRACDAEQPLGQRAAPQCTWTVPHPLGTIVLFGDSNAGHFTEPVVRAGNQAGYDVTVATYSSCPFVGIHTVGSCYRFATGTVDALVRLRPSLVIAAARTDAYLDGEHRMPPASRAGRIRLWRAALDRTLDRLNRAGIPVVVVHPVPKLPDAPDGCAVLRILLGRCGTSVSRGAADRSRRDALSIENTAAARATRSWTLGLDDDLCSAATCSSVRDGVVLYRNDEHLSVAGSRTITPAFARAIAANAKPVRAATR